MTWPTIITVSKTAGGYFLWFSYHRQVVNNVLCVLGSRFQKWDACLWEKTRGSWSPSGRPYANSKNKSFLSHAKKFFLFEDQYPRVDRCPQENSVSNRNWPSVGFLFAFVILTLLSDFSLSFVELLFPSILFPFSLPSHFPRAYWLESQVSTSHYAHLWTGGNDLATRSLAGGAFSSFQFGLPCSNMSGCSKGKCMRNRR